MKLSIGEQDYIVEPLILTVKGFWSKKVRKNLSSIDIPLKQFLEEVDRPFMILSRKGCYLNVVNAEAVGPFWLTSKSGAMDLSILFKGGAKYITRGGVTFALEDLMKQIKRGNIIIYTQKC